MEGEDKRNEGQNREVAKKKTKIKIISFIISFLWTGLGTLMVLSSSPKYNFLGFDYESFIFWFLFIITFPFNIILFCLLFLESDIYITVILLQSIKVLIYWWIIYKIFTCNPRQHGGQ